MDIFEHPLCNLLLKAPPDRPEVVDLPAWRGMVEVVDPSKPEGISMTHAVISFWKPTPSELALLNSNGCVALQCVGTTAPPVYVGVVGVSPWPETLED